MCVKGNMNERPEIVKKKKGEPFLTFTVLVVGLASDMNISSHLCVY